MMPGGFASVSLPSVASSLTRTPTPLSYFNDTLSGNCQSSFILIILCPLNPYSTGSMIRERRGWAFQRRSARLYLRVDDTNLPVVRVLSLEIAIEVGSWGILYVQTRMIYFDRKLLNANCASVHHGYDYSLFELFCVEVKLATRMQHSPNTLSSSSKAITFALDSKDETSFFFLVTYTPPSYKCLSLVSSV
jgi:hypothetical protein